MKIVSLLTTAAVVALIAGSASAQAVAPVAITETSYMNPANPGNSGTVSDDITATFSISGTVSPSCILGDGDAVLDDVNFGSLGIYGDASNGVDSAFEMVGTSNGNSSTNAAGCNTSNKLTLTKTNGALGLVNTGAAAVGYDNSVFQANIPYTLSAVYAAGNVGQLGSSANTGKFSVLTTEATNSRENNAWRGTLGVKVVIPPAAMALVAGTYTDTVTVQIEAL